MKPYKLTLTALLVLVLGACSGGSDDAPQIDSQPGTPPTPPTAGITGTGIAAGPITGFGSIWLNGVRYDTDNANFSVNGQPGIQDDLSVGLYIVLKGSVNADGSTGTATDVTYNDNVTGPIQSIDPGNFSLVVLGQTVTVSASTSFDDSIPDGSLDGLVVGDIVEISGIVTSDSTIEATRIELKPAGTDLEVIGIVTQLDVAALTFSVNQLTVDYSMAALDDFPNGAIENGQLVEVKGTRLNALDQLVADEVEYETSELIGDENDYIEIEGFITRFVSITDFDVAGIPVLTTAGTVYEDGQSSDLGLNVKIEVEGNFNASGQIVAEDIEIQRSSEVRLTATVDSVSLSDSQIVALGIPITIDGRTRLEDNSDADLEPFTIDNLNPGDYVEIRGSEQPAASGMITADLLEREDSETETELQGFVTSFTDPVITILGVTIDSSNAEFRDENDLVLTRAEFFNRLSVNSLLSVDGTETSPTTIVAEEIEFEDDD